ncbi:MAG: (2Fe-2S) ferredoxin domain-containing protein [Rickettsia endosymbiont of Bryobia graminum]|nr:(2Fe-2S) ferredoxin domain-containing protein [Rickettsia endosymbiont of Bryobia graminum]
MSYNRLSGDYHIFICQNQRPNESPKGCCMSKGSDKILEHFKKLTATLEANIHSNDPVNWGIQVT